MADRDPIVFATYVEMEQLSEAMASAWAEDSTLPAVFEMLLAIRELGEHLSDERRAGPDDMVIRISFIRPTDRFGGEPVPYIRTGINPAEDDPNSHNGQLHRESAGDHSWTSRTYPTGTTITLPHNDREPLEGGPYA